MEYLEANKRKAAEAEKEGRMLKGHKTVGWNVNMRHKKRKHQNHKEGNTFLKDSNTFLQNNTNLTFNITILIFP